MAPETPSTPGFNELYQEHHEWLVRWIARRTPGVDNAQDLAQDTFMRLLDRPSLPAGIRSPRAWLTKVAGNLLIDQARRQVLEKNYLALLESLPEPEWPSPEDKWELLGVLEQIDQLLGGLRPIEKTVFLMARLDGLTYRQVAEQQGLSLSSVEKYIAKAMLKCYAAVYENE
ncbi:sigma-70 family RNA polymerase sigma factor [Microbulbifer sp. SSSA002]|uniref:sigma-70 family RNA polymerase sigma factor n=1 Tax=unclassified Microbulbifer TaxID=2619833 RepID=UPI0040394E00